MKRERVSIKRRIKRKIAIDGRRYPSIPIIETDDAKNKRKPVSIIITAYRAHKFIEETLNSVENQTYFKDFDDYEILIGIDACKWTLNKILKIWYKYRNIRVFMMNSNMGTYVTSNTLLSLVKHENIIRFDSDDIMMPEMIDEIMDNVGNDDNNLLIRFGFYKLINGEIRINNGKSQYAHGAIYIQKSIYDQLGGYQPWMCAADTELLRRGIHIINEKLINKPIFHRRYHENSLTVSPELGMQSEKRKTYKEMLDDNIGVKIEKITNTYVEY